MNRHRTPGAVADADRFPAAAAAAAASVAAAVAVVGGASGKGAAAAGSGECTAGAAAAALHRPATCLPGRSSAEKRDGLDADDREEGGEVAVKRDKRRGELSRAVESTRVSDPSRWARGTAVAGRKGRRTSSRQRSEEGDKRFGRRSVVRRDVGCPARCKASALALDGWLVGCAAKCPPSCAPGLFGGFVSWGR